jgi:hypothetical protein
VVFAWGIHGSKRNLAKLDLAGKVLPRTFRAEEIAIQKKGAMVRALHIALSRQILTAMELLLSCRRESHCWRDQGYPAL